MPPGAEREAVEEQHPRAGIESGIRSTRVCDESTNRLTVPKFAALAVDSLTMSDQPTSAHPASAPPAAFTSVSVATTIWPTPRRCADITAAPADTATAWRCASLLTPLYTWVTPEADDADVVSSIVESDNTATDRIVEAAGGLTSIRERLNHHTGIDIGHAETWGRFVLSPAQVALMYARMQAAADPRSTAIIDLMRRTPTHQRFDTDRAWAYATEQDRLSLAVKSGWDLAADEPFARTHVVVLGRLTSAVLMTAVPVTDTDRAQWEAADSTEDPEQMLRLHGRWAGSTLRAALQSAAPTRVRRR